MHCCAKHLRHDTKGIRFLTLHMCFFPCKGGHNISLLIVVFRAASPPKNSVRSLGRALDNRVTSQRVCEDGYKIPKAAWRIHFFL